MNYRQLLLSNGPAYLLSGSASVLSILFVGLLHGSIPIFPREREIGMIMGLMGLGVVAYYSASLWYLRSHKPIQKDRILRDLSVMRFGEFAAAGIGGWAGFILTALVWNVFSDMHLSPLESLIFGLSAIPTTGIGAVHGVFALHSIVSRKRT